MKQEKTSLEKSHSKWSNFKLTLLSLITSLTVSSIWLLVAFKNYVKDKIFVMTIVLLGIISFICLICIKAFKR